LTRKSKILFAALIFAVATIPMKNQWNSIATIIFVATVAFQQPLAVTYHRLKQSRFWIIPVIYFVWLAFSHFWDSSGGYRLRDIERYLILFFIPPAMAAAPFEMKKFVETACMAFVGVTIAVCLLCLTKSYLEYTVSHDARIFYYQYLSEQAGLNAIFLSNFSLGSIVWLLYYHFLDKQHSKGRNIIVIVAICFLLFMIFLLSSKLLIFLTLLVLVIFVLMLGYAKGFFVRAIVITSLIVIAGVVAVSQMSYLKWRITSTEIKMYEGAADNQNGIAIRLYMWKTVADLIKKKPFMGYGIRGGRLETLGRYKSDGFEMGVQGDYHSHNQFLESMLMAGIPALLLLLGLMIGAISEAIRSRNFLLMLIVFHFICQSIIESTFEVQHELVFYIFFIFLFYYHGPKFRNAMP
jgi:O-antigen ligase